MPPLRDRAEDIPLLIATSSRNTATKWARSPSASRPDVVGLLESYSWPGNVRELENVIERIVAIEDRETVTANCLPQEIVSPR